MNSLNRWAAEGPRPVSPLPASSVPPPPLSEAEWARGKRLLLLSLVAFLSPQVGEAGDAADEARALAQRGLEAMRDHPRHGRNWWDKHGAELRAKVVPFFPQVFAPVELALAGADLLAVVLEVFPDARTTSREPTGLDRYYGRMGDKAEAPRAHGMPTGADAASPARPREAEPERGRL